MEGQINFGSASSSSIDQQIAARRDAHGQGSAIWLLCHNNVSRPETARSPQGANRAAAERGELRAALPVD
jgi:hypothetical protein